MRWRLNEAVTNYGNELINKCGCSSPFFLFVLGFSVQCRLQHPPNGPLMINDVCRKECGNVPFGSGRGNKK